ncbi:ParB/RepB/Spo0J family partition protein [Actinoplanes utahensis]|uniref:ParB/RepB/Spo0J family partition protein n=1 Tax=Actinoplanes utahensis TaxID=1869 RepID=UPI00191C4260|nr:ParB N-terminal domain-containing protein [Actinoplanes utahensis]
MRLSLNSLRMSGSPRLSGQDPAHVRLLAESGTALPPILVHRGSMRVIDGMHRVRAARLRGADTIEARFFDGSDEEAFVVAVKANRAHGLPLTFAEREAAATRLISRRPQCSDRAIADITGLSARTVGVIRRRAGDAGLLAPLRVGRDGRVRPLDGGDGRRLASEVIARRPEASLREIAREAGISPATARDVRERLRRGEDPLPQRLRDGRSRATASLAPVERRDARAVREPVTEVRPGTGGDRAATGRGHDWESMLHSLNRDPSLRFADSGRALLRWLFTHARAPDGWEQVIDAIPPHSAYIVAEVARGCADSWAEFADQLQHRLRASA